MLNQENKKAKQLEMLSLSKKFTLFTADITTNTFRLLVSGSTGNKKKALTLRITAKS